MIEAIVIGSACGGALIGYVAGVIAERMRWNDLIQKGWIPMPRGKGTGWSPHTWFKG